VSCVPGNPTAETCNDLDDNCDGTVDNGAFSDSFEPNADCATARTINSVGSNQSRTFTSMTIFSSGDADVYRIPMIETDTVCGCGSMSFDEDYRVDVTITVPANAGSYELCMNGAGCNFPSGFCFQVAAGQTTTLTQFLDGACGPGPVDSYDVYVRVRGGVSPGFECSPYSLSYSFTSGFCR
jgi:hypothetical protein